MEATVRVELTLIGDAGTLTACCLTVRLSGHMVGVAGFEPAAFYTLNRRDAMLRYTPINNGREGRNRTTVP